MRAVVQRARRANVTVDGTIVGEIGTGLVVLLGVTHHDTENQSIWMAQKIANLRIMDGETSVLDNHQEVLVVSQFTLYGDASKGRRPTWTGAAPGELAVICYEKFCTALEELGLSVERGVFGAHMEVELVNDGPITLILERD